MGISFGGVRRSVGLVSGVVLAAGLVLVVPGAPTVSAVTGFSKAFTPSTIGPGSVSTLTFDIVNADPAPATDITFTDTLPAGVTIATPANATSTCTSPVLSAPDGGTTISLSGASVAAGATCTVSVDVTTATPGTSTNVTSALTSSQGSAGSATADLVVDAGRPGFSKAFAPGAIDLGERSTLTFTVDNTANAGAAHNLAFTDTLVPGLTIADPANVSSDCGDADVVAAPGGSSIGVTDFNTATPTVAAGATCTISVDVKATAFGTLPNTSSDATTAATVNGISRSSGKASAVLTVTRETLHITKNFTNDPIVPGGTATLTIVISNFDRFDDATDVAFSDPLPAGVTVATPGNPSSTCGGTLTAADGAGSIDLTGASVGAGSSCTISVDVTAAAAGSFANTTSAVTGTIGGLPVSGNAATESLFVVPTPITISKSFTDDPVGAGDSVTLEFTITNDDAVDTASDITFTDELDAVLDSASEVNGNVGSTSASDACGIGSTLTYFPATTGGGPGGSPARVVLTSGSLAAGTSCTFDLVLGVAAGAAAGTYPNVTGDVTATIDGVTVTGAPATDDLVVVGAPTLRKEFTDDPVAPGGTVTLEFTLSNGGVGEDDVDVQGPATDIGFTDDLAAVVGGLTAVGLPADGFCGPLSTITSTATDTLLTVAGAELAEFATCTFAVTLATTAATPQGLFPNATGDVSAVIEYEPGVDVPVTGIGAEDTLVVADVGISKEFTDDPVQPGDTVTLDFTLENNGPGAVTDMLFEDDFDEVLDGLMVTAELGNTCGGTVVLSSGDMFFTYVGGSLAANSSCAISLELTVPGGAEAGQYPNLTSALSATIGGVPVTLPGASDVLEVGEPADVVLSKEFIDDPVAPGQDVTLRFTLANQSTTVGATGLAFTDDLVGGISPALAGLSVVGAPPNPCGGTLTDGGGTLLGFTDGSLAPGEVCTFDVVLAVPAGASPGNYLNTSGALTGDDGVSTPAATAGLVVSGETGRPVLDAFERNTPATSPTNADTLVFDITFDQTVINVTADDFDITGTTATGVLAGSGSTYTLTVSGGDLAGLDGTVGLDLAAGQDITDPSGFALPPGEPAIDETYVLDNTAPVLLAFARNTPATSPTDADTLVFDITFDEDVSNVTADDFDITGTTATGVLAGSGDAYTLTVSGGDLAGLNGIVGLDLAPGQDITDTAGNALPPGEPAIDETYELDNTAPTLLSIERLDPATSPTNADTLQWRLTFSEEVSGVVDVLLGMEVTGATPSSTTVSTSDDVVYTYEIAGGDLPNLNGIVGLDIKTGSGISDVVGNALVEVEPPIDETYELDNTAPVLLAFARNTPATSPTDADTLVFDITFDEDVSNVTADDFDITGTTATGVLAGSGDAYTLTVSGGDLAGLNGIVGLDLAPGQDITDTAGNALPPGEPAIDETYELINTADLSIAKTASHDPAFAGYGLTYTIDVENAGPAVAVNVVVTDTLPSGVTLVSAPGCVEAPVGTLTCAAGDLAPGDPASFTIEVAIDETTLGTITNDASVTSDTPDDDTGNNTASVDTEVIQGADLSIEKIDKDDPVESGKKIKYTITVFNAGPLDAVDVEVTDLLPAGVTFKKTKHCDNGNDAYPVCELGTIDAGDSADYEIEVDVADETRGTITNTATVTSATPEPDESNNTASESTLVCGDKDGTLGFVDCGTVTEEADLSIEKIDKKDPVESGKKIEYTITVFNAGPGPAVGVVVTDILPTGVTFEKTSGCAEHDGIPDCTLGTIEAGDSEDYKLTVETDDDFTGMVTNTASVTSLAPDSNTANNTATETTTVVADDDDDDDDDGDDDDGDDDDGDDNDLLIAGAAPAAPLPATPPIVNQTPIVPVGGLPATGSDGTSSLIITALGALALGSVLLGTTRRRRFARARTS